MNLKVLVHELCPHCKKCISFLKKNDVKFEVIDVDKETKWGDELEWRIGMRRCPHFVIDGEWVSPCDPNGWSEEKTRKILGL